jgi:hypothetical protein
MHRPGLPHTHSWQVVSFATPSSNCSTKSGNGGLPKSCKLFQALLFLHLGTQLCCLSQGCAQAVVEYTRPFASGSSGVSIVVETYVSLKRRGGDLELLCPGGRVLQVLTVLHLLDIIPSFDDEAQALASFVPRSHSASS